MTYPPGWRTVEFDQFTTLKRGQDLTKDQFRVGVVPVAGSNGVIGFHDAYNVAGPGVTVGRSGSVGRVTYYENHFWAHNTSLYVSDFHDNDPRFAAYFLKFLGLERYRSGASVPTLDRNVFRRLPVTVPELAEQRRIAHVLSLVQQAIEQQEQLRELTAELKRALLYELFNKGVRSEPQKETKVGPIPHSWQLVRLEDVATIERGKFSHRPRNDPRFYGGSTPFVQTGDVSVSGGRITRYSQTLNDEGLKISKLFPAGTILITIAANIGFSGILQFDAACPDSLVGLTPNQRTTSDFLNYYLATQQAEMDRLAPRGTQKNINLQFLRPWPVRLPQLSEQKEIAGILSIADDNMQLTQRKHLVLCSMFQTLLYELMTGRLCTRDHAEPRSIAAE
jgi:type I restriction enzyme, S subunit